MLQIGNELCSFPLITHCPFIQAASQHGGQSLIVDEGAIDEELKEAEVRNTYAPWKLILMVGGVVVGVALLVGALVLVIKSNRPAAKSDSDEEDTEMEEVSLK